MNKFSLIIGQLNLATAVWLFVWHDNIYGALANLMVGIINTGYYFKVWGGKNE